jgi:intracellular sulfur oxidation DsrE/DsrF family protein
MSRSSLPSSERRSFLHKLNTGVASFAAMAGVAMAQQKAPGGAKWEPARHERDDWFEQIPGKHRLLFDSNSGDNLGDALAFAGNYYRANKTDYGLEPSDLATVIIVRHRSTPFGFNDKIWAKYGMPMATRAKLEDPRSKLAPKVNLYNAGDLGEMMYNRGVTLNALAAMGVQFAVCAVSTRGYAAVAAATLGGDTDAIYNEMVANLIANARMVPAGIIALNRAQERGYTLSA